MVEEEGENARVSNKKFIFLFFIHFYNERKVAYALIEEWQIFRTEKFIFN